MYTLRIHKVNSRVSRIYLFQYDRAGQQTNFRTFTSYMRAVQPALHVSTASPRRLSRTVVMGAGGEKSAEPTEPGPVPAWLKDLEAQPGNEALSADYWSVGESQACLRHNCSHPTTAPICSRPPQPHGSDTVMGLLHDGDDPACHGARVVFEEKESKQVLYSCWPLGKRVCGHPGLVHGGVTALMLDEAFGQSCASGKPSDVA